MRVPYHCTHSRDVLKDYYTKQAAYGLPVYAGSRHQKGHNFFSSLFRFAVPMIKKAGIGAAKQLLSAGTNIISDVSQGKSLKESAKSRLAESGKNMQKAAVSHLAETGRNLLGSLTADQSGSGIRRRHKKSTQTRQKSKKFKKDIFSK